jgi:3,4-dihydroxy 2-butanone 4-phosphate synthase/GTP cyclohydrolase II
MTAQAFIMDAANKLLSRGAMVVVVDSVRKIGVAGFAGHALTPSRVNFLISECRGILYAGIPADRLDHLGLSSQTTDHGIGGKIRVSVDWAAGGMTTGISAVERANTIRALLRDDDPASFRSPGHVVPVALYPDPGFEHFYLSEALQYLCSEPDRHSGVVLCAVLREDGMQANPDELRAFADSHQSVAIDVADVLRARRSRRGWPDRWPSVKSFELRHFARSVLVRGVGLHSPREELPVSVHALCIYGQVLGGDCDCGLRLEAALARLRQVDAGAVVIAQQYARIRSGLRDGFRCAAHDVAVDGLADLIAAELSAGAPVPLLA